MFKKMLMLERMQFVVVVVSLFELKQSTNTLSHLMLANKRVREFVPFAFELIGQVKNFARQFEIREVNIEAVKEVTKCL